MGNSKDSAIARLCGWFMAVCPGLLKVYVGFHVNVMRHKGVTDCGPSWCFGLAPKARLPSQTLVLHALRVNGKAVRIEIAVQSPPAGTVAQVSHVPPVSA